MKLNRFKSFKKRKILFVSEASFASTGYGAYYKNLINRVYDSGKYRVAEFASFAVPGDPKDQQVRWRFYANQPLPNASPEEHQQFNSNEANKTGQWRLDKVLLDFQCDILVEMRDSTMAEFQTLTPLRKFFFHAISPSIDSSPQIDSWVGYMLQADAFLGYSHYAMDVAKKEGGGKIKTFKTAYPGVDTKTFFPVKNKGELRKSLGVDPECNIVMMCGRNQIRKLFPELIKSFRIYLDKMASNNIDTYNKSMLYLHTTMPDLKTWNINKLIVEYNLTSKVLFSYHCNNCKKYFINRFQDATTTCVFCGKEAMMPRVDLPVNTDDLNKMYNVADCYVQLASAGATEFPLVEAAATGCTIMATNWAGTGDACKRLGGVLLKTSGTPRDINVDADRATPDNEHLAEELFRFFSRPRQLNLRNGIKTSEIAKKKFSWDKNAEIWMSLFDSCQLTGYQGKWSANINWKPQSNLPDNLPVQKWVYNILDLTLQENHLKHSIFIDEMIKYCELKIRSTGNGIVPWTRNEIANILQTLINNKSTIENIRTGTHNLPEEDWMKYAEVKELLNLK